MKTKTFHPATISFWTSFWVHMRPYLLFISGIAGIAGMAIGYRGDGPGFIHILAGIGFFLSYGFGQALTDCFQVDTDSISAAYRPLSRGIISKKHVLIVSTLGLFVCAGFIVLANIHNLAFCLLSIFGLATYSKIKRKYWWGGPFYNAWIVALLPVMGYLVTSGGGFSDLPDSELMLTVLLNFFAYTNFVLIGYLKDIRADRETGYLTFPVVYGWNRTVIAGTLISVICILICSLLIEGSVIPFLLFCLAGGLSLWGNARAWTAPEKNEAHASMPIEMTVRSFILWNIAVIVQFHPALLLPAVVYFILFELVLMGRPEHTQI